MWGASPRPEETLGGVKGRTSKTGPAF